MGLFCVGMSFEELRKLYRLNPRVDGAFLCLKALAKSEAALESQSPC